MKVRVPVIGTVGKSVQVESDAPSRSEMQTAIDAAVKAAIAKIPASSSSSTGGLASTIWRLIREIPQNIQKLATLGSNGLITRRSNGDMTVRSIATVDPLDLTVTNGSGDSGNPTVGLGTSTIASLALADTAVQPADLDPLKAATYVTVDDETTLLTNSRQLVAGSNITFDTTVPGMLEISSTGGGGGGGDGNITPDTHPDPEDDADDEFEFGTAIDTSGARRVGAIPWAWVNQGTATGNVAQGSLVFAGPGQTGSNLRIVEQAITDSAYKYRCKLTNLIVGELNFSGAGICVRNSSSGKIIAMYKLYNSGYKIGGDKWNSVSSYNSSLATAVAWDNSTGHGSKSWTYFEIEKSGTNIIFRYSESGVDGTFITFATEALATFITSVDRIGLVLHNDTNSNPPIGVYDWWRKVSGSGVLLYRVGITVAAASVASNLTAFPVYVDLSGMPSGFWTHLASTRGADIRVYNSSNAQIPFDLFRLDPIAQSGAMFVRTDLSSSVATTFYIEYGDPARALLPPTDTYGRNAVWADYHRVYLMGESFADRTGNGADLIADGSPTTFTETSTSANLGVHQGVAYDGTYYYLFDTNSIKKYDASFSLVATNSNPVGDVGNGTNHVGDGCVVDGVIYLPVENYTNISTWSNQRLARFDAATLAFIDSVSVSAQGAEVSSVCYCEDDDRLYVTSFADGSKLWKYNRSSLAFISTVSLSSTIPEIQGITYWRGAFWINSDNTDATYRVEYNGTVRPAVYNKAGAGGAYEGIDHTLDGLLVLHDTSGSGTGVIRTIKPDNQAKAVRGGGEFNVAGAANAGFHANGLSKYTTWTMGATISIAAKGANGAIVSYESEASSGTTDRVTFAFRNTTDRIGLWNVTDGWLENSIGAPSTNTAYRVNCYHNGTSGRGIYVNGANATTTGSSTAKPTGSAPMRIWIALENAIMAEDFRGSIGFVYLRPSVLTANWLAAEYSNINAPGSFYSVGPETLV